MKRALSIKQYALLFYLALAVLPIAANIFLMSSTHTTAEETAKLWQKTLVQSLSREINEHISSLAAQLTRIGTIEQQYGRRAAEKAMHRTLNIVTDEYYALYLTDKNGYILSADFSTDSGGLASDFIEMKLTGIDSDLGNEAQWTSFLLSIQSKTPTVRLAFPIADIFVVGDFNLVNLQKRLKQLELPVNSSLFLVDNLGNGIFPTKTNRRDTRDNPLVQAALAGRNSLFGYGASKKFIGSTASLPVNGWFICFEQSKDDVFALHHQLMQRNIFTIIVGFLLLCLTLLFLHKRILLPLQWIIDRSREIPKKRTFEPQTMPLAAVDLTRLWQVLRGSVHKLQRREKHLILARQEAEAASRAKSAFLARMSHELRTPLNGILGYTQQLQHDENLNGKQHSSIHTIHDCSEHLLEVINHILDFSKIEAGGMILHPAPFLLESFLQKIVVFFQYQATAKDVDFIFDIGSSLPQVIVADGLRLRQILFNLLGNGLKFTSRGELRFQVRTETEVNGEQLLYFSVEDTGPGIPAAQQEKIFQPFIQDESHLHHREGTGLGLAISHDLVALMGGNLLLESPVPDRRQESGCRFSFFLSVETENSAMLAEGEQMTDLFPDMTSLLLQEDFSKIPHPPPETIEKLLSMVSTGDISEIDEILVQTETMNDGRYRQFVEAMSLLAENLQLPKMETILIKILNRNRDSQPE